MRAVLLREFGPAGNLAVEEVPDLAPGPGQVRIAVQAAGVHLIDTELRAGKAMGALPLPELPQVPGREVAGIVDLAGPGVDPGLVGRSVVVHLGAVSGGYAAQAVCDAGRVHEIPATLSFTDAVALIGTGRTAAGITETAQIGVADTVIVTAAAGGLGSLLIQETVASGGFAVAVAGGNEKVALATDLGAQVAVDYLDSEWPAAVRARLGGRQPTIALDGVGGDIGRAAMKLLGPGGRLLLFGWSSGRPTEFGAFDLYANGLTVGVAIGPQMMSRPGGLRAMETTALANGGSGRWRPLTTRFALGDAAAAHTALAGRRTTGKVVLVP